MRRAKATAQNMKTVLSVSVTTDVPEALETIRAVAVIGGLPVRGIWLFV
jgi:hypothetical protein